MLSLLVATIVSSTSCIYDVNGTTTDFVVFTQNEQTKSEPVFIGFSMDFKVENVEILAGTVSLKNGEYKVSGRGKADITGLTSSSSVIQIALSKLLVFDIHYKIGVIKILTRVDADDEFAVETIQCKLAPKDKN